jgi:hypothetical protein
MSCKISKDLAMKEIQDMELQSLLVSVGSTRKRSAFQAATVAAAACIRANAEKSESGHNHFPV